MIFEQLLFQAKEGDLESITDILNMYRPLLLRKVIWSQLPIF